MNIVLLILCWGQSGGARCVVLVLGSVCGCGPWSAVRAGFRDFLVLCRLGGAAHGLSQVESSARVPASSPEVYPAGKLQRQLTCGFDFRHSLLLPFVAAFAVPKGLTVFY